MGELKEAKHKLAELIEGAMQDNPLVKKGAVAHLQALHAASDTCGKAVLTLTTLERYVKENPDGPCLAVDYDLEAAAITAFLCKHLPTPTVARIFRAETLLENLYDGVVGYRGDRMPLRDAKLNEVFNAARIHIYTKE